MIEQVRLADIVDGPYQPRSELGDVAELAESIDAAGLAHPPVGRRRLDGSVELALGRRRIAAVRQLAEAGRWRERPKESLKHPDRARPPKRSTVEVDVRELSDGEMVLLGLAENTSRDDLNPVDRLRSWQMAIKGSAISRPDVAAKEVARVVGISPQTLNRYLTILRLPDRVLDQVRSGRLKYTVALHLVELLCDRPDAQELIAEVFEQVIEPDGRLVQGTVRRRIEEAVTADRRWAQLTFLETESELYCAHRLRLRTGGVYYTCEGLKLTHVRGLHDRSDQETSVTEFMAHDHEKAHPYGRCSECDRCDDWRTGWAAGQVRMIRDIQASTGHPADCSCTPCRVRHQAARTVAVAGDVAAAEDSPDLSEFTQPQVQAYDKTCRECGSGFRGRLTTKYCSRPCSVRASRGRNSTPVSCRWCKGTYNRRADRPEQMYCSRTCSQEAQRGVSKPRATDEEAAEALPAEVGV